MKLLDMEIVKCLWRGKIRLIQGTYVKKDEQTTVYHFRKKLLKLKDKIKTKVVELEQGSKKTHINGGVFSEEWNGEMSLVFAVILDADRRLIYLCIQNSDNESGFCWKLKACNGLMRKELRLQVHSQVLAEFPLILIPLASYNQGINENNSSRSKNFLTEPELHRAIVNSRLIWAFILKQSI
ncbi:hypothetical protein PanWU01x14_036160 [Parasponia andersonii]|uniref:Uncharacterized protein n=1 Tax=Parasponia andersonii TaxID=3476 RepID=A0A2P5DSE2_PARAD|nr:hypothetical protein PanWU01x14_036160 [Parasponia andersonii]